MPSTKPLLERLEHDFPALHFEADEVFAWQPNNSTITYDVADPYFEARLLHELGHAQLEHDSYERDIELIGMERDAWAQARTELASRYSAAIPTSIVHHDMDTYREWLHKRSTCPACESNGLQIKKSQYRCVTCQKTWHVNEARTCQLRRYNVT